MRNGAKDKIFKNGPLAKKLKLSKLVNKKKKTLQGPGETAGRHSVELVDPKCKGSYQPHNKKVEILLIKVPPVETTRGH